MNISEGICACVEIIGKGIVPPVMMHSQHDNNYIHLTYYNVVISEALGKHTPEEALQCKRKFRKYFRLACSWKESLIDEHRQRSISNSKRWQRKPFTKHQAQKIELTYQRQLASFRRSVGIDKKEDGTPTKMSRSKMRNRQHLVIDYLLAKSTETSEVRFEKF